MRLVIDLQGAQTGSRFRGIGRYSLAIAKAIAKLGAQDEILIALSGLFPDSIGAIRAEFSDVLPAENIRVWNAVGPVREIDDANRWRCAASEQIRETFLASLQPDVVFITSLFEGLGDDAVSSINVLKHGIPTAVLLHDLIPLVSPDEHFRASGRHRRWYRRKIRSLRQSSLLLAVSESSRQEALSTGLFPEKGVVNISGACGEQFRILKLSSEQRADLWTRLGISRPFVMYTGAADERKNLHRLLEAYAGLPSSLRQTRQLVFAGKMPKENVANYIDTGLRCGVAREELVFTGYIDDLDLVKLYNTCEAFVFPSTHEGFGLPVLEAMSCGAPVIGSNAKSLPEVIGLREATFDPLSIPEIRSKLERVLIDRKFRESLIRHGESQIRKFSWGRSAEVALDAMRGIAQGKSRRISPNISVESTAAFYKRRLRILVIKLDHLGDFMLAVPALSKLRARYPYASINIVLGSWNAPIGKDLGLFDKIYEFDYFKRKSSELPEVMEDALAELLAQLGHFDIAIDLRRPADTRFLLMRVNADVKVAYATMDEAMDTDLDVAVRTYPDIPFVTSPLNRTSISQQMLRVVDAIPADPNDYVALPPLSCVQASEAGRIAIFPKAGNAAREWSGANFSQLMELLVGNGAVINIDLYFANEREQAEFPLPMHRKIKTFTGLSFEHLVHNLSRASVCVANNSGGGHLASYLGLTVIGIYSGHELPSEWGLQFCSSVAIHRAAKCAPCHGARADECPNDLFCLNDISVPDVYQKAVEALGSFGNGGGSAAQASPAVSLQWDCNTLVKHLFSGLAHLEGSTEQDLVDAAEAISANHPNYSLPDTASVRLNAPTDHKSPHVDWRGFSGIEPEFRWTEGHNVALVFECPEGTPPKATIVIKLDTLGQQRISGMLNNRRVIETTENGTHIPMSISVENLESGINVLELELPDARLPGNGDGRKLAVAVREFSVNVSQTTAGQ